MAPEIKKAVEQRVAYLERQLAAARNFQRSLEEEEHQPIARGPRRKAGKAKISKQPKPHEHSLAQGGMTHREYVRQLLRKYEANGLTPSEMLGMAANDKRGVAKSFPYAQLATMRKDKEVRKANGKYFPMKAGEAKNAANI